MSTETNHRHLIARIREALAEDPRTHVLDLRVTASAEEIWLLGAVACEERRRLALEVAREKLPLHVSLVDKMWIEHWSEPTAAEPIA